MKTPKYIAYQITETGKKDDNGKDIAFWNRVGAAWENSDGSINVQFDALPLDGKVQLRVPKEKDNG